MAGPGCRIHLVSMHDLAALPAQTPGGDGVWDQTQFLVSRQREAEAREEREGDWLVAYDQGPGGMTTRIPWERRIVVLSEPPEIKRYYPAYLNQFGCVLSALPIARRRGRAVRANPAYPWMFDYKAGAPATLDWAALQAAGAAPRPAAAEGCVSAVCSTKRLTLQQERRLRFLEILERRLGPRLRLFGRGFQEIDRKSEAILAAPWHLAMENSLAPHGWTEKLADPLIGRAAPLYFGDPAAERYFPEQAFSRIDLRRPKAAAEQVDRLLDGGVSEERRAAIDRARERLFTEHNLFAVLTRLMGQLRAAGAPTGLDRTPQRIDKPFKAWWLRGFPAMRVEAGPARRAWLETTERG